MTRPFAAAIRAAVTRRSRSSPIALPTSAQIPVLISTTEACNSVLNPGASRKRSTAATGWSVSASRIISSSSIPTVSGADSPKCASITRLLAADAVHGSSGRLPRVVRRARPEVEFVRDDARIPSDLFRAAGMTEQIRIVPLLPDEDEMRRRHELGDVGAARRWARERIGAYAVPAGVVAVLVAAPELLVLERLDFLGQPNAAAPHLLPLHGRNGSARLRRSVSTW